MSNRSIATLSFRLAGIYALVEMAGYTRNVAYIITLLVWPMDPTIPKPPMNEINRTVLVEAFPLLLLGILACFLIFKARTMAAWVFPDSEGEAQSQPFPAIHAFAYSVVGLILVVSQLPHLVALIAMDVWKDNSYVVSSRQHIYLIEPMLMIVLGIALFFSSHGLVRLWSRLRYSGIRRQMGLCIRCGCDLTGNTTGVCPECGTNQTPSH